MTKESPTAQESKTITLSAKPQNVTSTELLEPGDEESSTLRDFQSAFNNFASGSGRVRVASLDVFKAKKTEGGS